ncbi:protein of unknown function [Streptomyces zhaozhouensis]|uniref:DUF4913 domain-containing protein n=1 Tax=Streptomyces zhaozhouensis TaxID=1300267 RepID=A0A286E967_9ACTN|nr:DUF4913 domain-containing protein [Streptomyces zhaozhouensis]SOD67446.1 protein of unknown function [Streptomyces zhaozhouensis]
MTVESRTGEQLAEDVADLTATVHGLAAQLEETQRLAESLQGQGALPAGNAGGGAEQPAAPPLILKLSGEKYDQELASLSIWVEYVLVPVYLAEVSTAAPWCERWWEHVPAVARLHALWLAWQELTTPEVGGYTGPSVWARDHLRPTMDDLRSPSGPFAACTTNTSRQRERILEAGQIRALPKGRALLLATGTPVAMVKLRPWYTEPHARTVGPEAAAEEAAIAQRAAKKALT